MRFAYADPPYVGKAHLYPEQQEVDHEDLIDYLVEEFPDGWALSASSPSLRYLLPLCPAEVRVMAWVKPFAIFKPHVNPGYAWEPLIVHGGRARGRHLLTVRDWLACNITLRRNMVGAKPDPFCYWLFEVLGMQPEDDFVDIFPGSGAVSQAWQKWRTRLPISTSAPASAASPLPLDGLG